MKKNLLAIIILALQMVTIALTAVMMISVTSTNNSTASLVKTIATVLNLEFGDDSEETGPATISLEDTEVWKVSETMTVPLKIGESGKQVYMVCDISLKLNTKHDDYSKYSATLSDKESLIKDAIRTVISSHDEAFCRNNIEELKSEILKAIQDLYGSDFIYGVAIGEVKFG